MNQKLGIPIILASFFLICAIFLTQSFPAYGYQGESITYVIKPLGGIAEYSDLGLVDVEGKQVNVTVFKTNVFGFKDIERIYSDPESLLPIRVEREVRWWLGKENIVEEYNQKEFKVTIRKYKGGKQVNEQTLSADGPIYNAILVPFYIRKVFDIKIGWSFVFRLPQKYEARVTSFDEIRVGEKKYSACHFTSIPDKFEIWISNDDARIPLKIKGKGSFNYTLLMKEYTRPHAN